MPARIMEIGLGSSSRSRSQVSGRGVGVGLFAPDEPGRRLLAMSDETARLMTWHLTWAARVLGTVIFLNVLLRALVGPCFAHGRDQHHSGGRDRGLCSVISCSGSADDVDEADDVSGAQWLRGAGWLLVAGIAISLVTGYIGLAAFLAGRFLVALGVIGALYIRLVFIDSLFTEILTAQYAARPQGRGDFFGIKPRAIELIGTLLSAVIRLLLILVVLLPLLGPWGIFAADFFGVVREAAFGFRIGDITISLASILSAAALLFDRHSCDARRAALAADAFSSAHHARSEPAEFGLDDLRLCRHRRDVSALALRCDRHRSAEDHACRRRALDRHRLRPAVGRVEFRLRPDPAGGAADPGRRHHQCQRRGGPGPPHPCARDRDRDRRPRQRDHPEFRTDHRRREELDACQYARAAWPSASASAYDSDVEKVRDILLEIAARGIRI